ncbi:galactosyltransferase-related protein [Thalassomonas sp. RHCl1]|uniref:galactosyltransferase-related protein n=1 Tax=Thalassomonas sp. RHCl1 TaxID=2995320 RepID=UPI00248ABCE8|nr:galactosyltransferase-related protein [Thalassomonas sp. RHCl1]
MKDNCICNPEQIDYIISYRESSVDRRKALFYVVSRLHQTFDKLNIIIVEQDDSPKLTADDLPYCQLIFVFNAGLFNRGWSNNVGVNASMRPFVAFADCDIFLTKQSYQSCFDALQVFDAVDPKKSYITNVDLAMPTTDLAEDKKIVQADMSQVSATYTIKNRRYGNTFAGGIFFIRRQSLQALGFWDENFEGWGGEDNAMEHVIRLFLRQCRLQLEVFHIDHSRSWLDTRAQPGYQSNSQRCRAICAIHGQALLEYLKEKKQCIPGAIDKYRVSKPEQNAQAKNKHRDEDAYICSSQA